MNKGTLIFVNGKWKVRITNLHRKTISDSDVTYSYPERINLDFELHPNPCINVGFDFSEGKIVDFTIIRFCNAHQCDINYGPCTLDCAYDEVQYAKIMNTHDMVHNESLNKNNVLLTWDELQHEWEVFCNTSEDPETWNFFKWVREHFDPPKRKNN